MNSTDGLIVDNSFLSGRFVPRPRIEEILEQAAGHKLVYVIAGSGYGKTQAVSSYIKQQEDAIVRWVQLTESDNVVSHYWDNIVHNVSLDNPDLALKMGEAGFPETPMRFQQFAGILRDTEHRAHKTFLILDDFHLIHSKQALTFTERCAYLDIPGACLVIISRKEPGINAVSLFSKGLACIITEEELCFTNSEISDFLIQCGVQFSIRDLPRFADATKGWALAVNLLAIVLKRAPENLGRALGTMRQNIFKLIQMEAFDDFPEKLKKTMVQLSLVSDLPYAFSLKIADYGSIVEDTPQLASFLWFDSFSDDYRVQPLYLEFLQSKQDILSTQEKQELYRQAAKWCSENGYYMGAMDFYAKSRQFGLMLKTLLSYPFKLPHDTCEYYLGILENLDPSDEEYTDENYLLLTNLFIPLLLVGAGRYDEARERTAGVIREWEDSDTPFAVNLLYTAYSNLAYIDTYTCTVTHKYESSGYLKKALEYYKKLEIPPEEVKGAFAVADVRSYACLIGEGAGLAEFDLFIEATKETIEYSQAIERDLYYGYDDLLACELAYYRNQLDLARQYAHVAIAKAKEKNQYSIEAMAEQYLLSLTLHDGDYPMALEILKQLRGHLDNPNFWNRQLLYDLFTGSFYSKAGLPEMAPAWFAMEVKETANEIRIPGRELSVGARYLIAAKKYTQALTVLCISNPRAPEERFLFSELSLSLLSAVAKIRTDDTEGAIEDFEKAYQLSFCGEFEMFFIEFGKDLHPLIAAASQAGCEIPSEWLKTIERKSSIFAKKANIIRNSVKREKNIHDTAELTGRELDILKDLYQGLSREEIAENQYISINTVKKMLQSIFTKLDANNSVDAIRVALQKRLIG